MVFRFGVDVIQACPVHAVSFVAYGTDNPNCAIMWLGISLYQTLQTFFFQHNLAGFINVFLFPLSPPSLPESLITES